MKLCHFEIVVLFIIKSKKKLKIYYFLHVTANLHAVRKTKLESNKRRKKFVILKLKIKKKFKRFFH